MLPLDTTQTFQEAYVIDQKLSQLGVQKSVYVNSQVLCLPENILSESEIDKLLEPADQIWLVKRLKEEGLSVVSLIEAGIEVGTIERRGNEKWLGYVAIDKLALPMLVAVLSGIAVVTYDRATKQEQPKNTVHVDLNIRDKDRSSKIQYDGDGESLVKMLEALNEKAKP
jgi:hypothetical protein